MYYGNFINKKHHSGKPYRSESGELIIPCSHFWIAYPVYEDTREERCGIVYSEVKKISHFTLVCEECGEVTSFNVDKIFENSQLAEKYLDNTLKEAK